MATGGGDIPRPLPAYIPIVSSGYHGKKRKKLPTSKCTTSSNDRFQTDENLARRLQEEEEKQMLSADQMCAGHLQEQFDGLSLGSDHLAAKEVHMKELKGTEMDDMALAQELSDRDLAYKLQVESDQQIANEVSAEENQRLEESKNRSSFNGRLNHYGTRGRGLGRGMMDRNNAAPQRPQTLEREHNEIQRGNAIPVMNSNGTLYLPEDMVPFFLNEGASDPPGALHPALLNLRPHLSDDQWTAMELNPMAFFLQMTGMADPDMGLEDEDFSGDNYEALWDLAERIGEGHNRGMSSEDIETLPTSQYEISPSPCGSGSSDSSNKVQSGEDNSQECKVCLSDFKTGETLRTLPCYHRYHSECIDEWIKRNAVCPVCRLGVKENLRSSEEQNI